MKKIALVLGIAVALSGCVINPHPMSQHEQRYWQHRADQNAWDAAHNEGLWAKHRDHSRNEYHHHHHAWQYAQSAHRHHFGQPAVMPVAVKLSGYGITFRLEPDNIGYIDDKVAAVEEDNEVATAYAVGLNIVVWYKQKHKAALIDHSGRFVGWLK